MNIFTVSQLANHHSTSTIDSSYCTVQDYHTRRLIGAGHNQGGLCYMDHLQLSGFTFTTTATTSPPIPDITFLMYGIAD